MATLSSHAGPYFAARSARNPITVEVEDDTPVTYTSTANALVTSVYL